MVYLREILKHNKTRLNQYKNIELAAYLYSQSPVELSSHLFDLSPEEELAMLGYKKERVDIEKIVSIVSKSPIKGISALSNVYKFAGLYLSAKTELIHKLKEKYEQSDYKQKYFLSKIEPSLKSELIKDIENTPIQPVITLIKKIYDANAVNENEFIEALEDVLSAGEIDVQLQILLEDISRALLQIKLINKTAEEVIRDALNNFSNAIRKISSNRRKGHPEFKIEDEYDVQDILYVILKTIFPNLKDEDAIPKVGAKSTKIDLIIREERILIEVKMMKENDGNETHFIEQLKADFESYYQCKWLRKLFCFVYDPYKRTRDTSNFNDLNGERTKGGHTFNVEVIIAN
jgi:REase_DpnII-MboI